MPSAPTRAWSEPQTAPPRVSPGLTTRGHGLDPHLQRNRLQRLASLYRRPFFVPDPDIPARWGVPATGTRSPFSSTSSSFPEGDVAAALGQLLQRYILLTLRKIVLKVSKNLLSGLCICVVSGKAVLTAVIPPMSYQISYFP